MNISVRDIDIATRTVWGEARGEDYDGKKAVAHVILNRSSGDLWGDGKPDWWGETVEQVCLKPRQFSCWNENDPNRAKMLALSNIDAYYQECEHAFLYAADEEDFTDGATHYHVAGLHPKWAAGKSPQHEFGHHLFYCDIEPGDRSIHKMYGPSET